MAFKNVSEKSVYKKLTDLKQGEQLLGYVVAITDSLKIEGQKNITMLIGEETVVVNPSGNVRYMLSDGKILIGPNTRITRIADKMVKGRKSTQFTVEQDLEDILAASGAASSSVTASSTTTASKIDALKKGASAKA